MFHSHLTKQKVAARLEHVAEGCGVRQTERLVGVHRDTVTRYTRKAGDHARAAHDEWVALSPLTTEVQFDEKWSFVAQKEAHRDRSDPADDHRGDSWGHVAFDPENRLVIAVVPGARHIESTEASVGEFRRRTGGRTMRLMTSDRYPAYRTAILGAYGETVTPPRTGRPGPPGLPRADLVYAAVEKVKAKGRVVEILTHVVFGAMAAALIGLACEPIDQHVVPRAGELDGPAPQREEVAEDLPILEGPAVPRGGHFRWPVRTLREPSGEGHWRKRTPAMSAGLTDHVWSISEWISLPVVLSS